MNTPPGTPGPAAAASAQQLTEQVSYLTARFADLEAALTESERLRQVQAEEIANLRSSAVASSGPVGNPAGPSSGPAYPPLAPNPIVDTRVFGEAEAFQRHAL